MKKNRLLITSIGLLILCLISLSLFSFSIFKFNIIPLKYLIFVYGFILITILILIYLMFSKKSNKIKAIANIILAILIALFMIMTFYYNKIYSFINEFNNNYDTLTYSVIVLKDKFKDINELKSIMYLNDDYKDDIKNILSSKINYEEILFDNMSEGIDSLLNEEVDAIVLEDSYYILAKDIRNNFDDKINKIYSFEVKVKTYDDTDIDVMEPFILYISGIDQYGDVKTVRGRSDVNQLVVVNPKTNKILLVNTPRDYYVQLAGTTGLKDKLTHAGVYGIEKSIGTLENLYDIDINHYLRVNFNTVVELVDIIGGIEVYSDTELDINDWHIVKGNNYMDGEKALAYSRERHAYITGDHHRGANQQQVITAILEKVTKSSVLISKYNSILNVLKGSFQTDMSMAEITAFIRFQLNEMPKWDIKSIAVTGYNSSNYTYSMGSKYKLYVMEPDWNSVENAKKEIREVLNEN